MDREPTEVAHALATSLAPSIVKVLLDAILHDNFARLVNIIAHLYSRHLGRRI
jgi:hypothetical protein